MGNNNTKAELVAYIELQSAQLRHQGKELESLRYQLSIARGSAPAQRSLPLGFTRAREAAMRTGHAVKVGL